MMMLTQERRMFDGSNDQQGTIAHGKECIDSYACCSCSEGFNSEYPLMSSIERIAM